MDWAKILSGLANIVGTISRKVYDDSQKKNAEKASGAGLEVRVSRTYDDVGLSGRRDCQFCIDRECTNITLAEAYEIGVFQRHPGCACEITYTTEKKTTIQTDWTKNQWEEVNQELLEERKKIGIDTELENVYNNPPAKKSIGELRTIYAEDVEQGWISPLSGFENYLKLYSRIEDEIVGQTTVNGITISSQSRHFMQRVLGTAKDPAIFNSQLRVISRSGVAVDDISQALLHGTPSPIIINENGPSQVFIGEKCKVSLNPETGNLIQCNPR